MKSPGVSRDFFMFYFFILAIFVLWLALGVVSSAEPSFTHSQCVTSYGWAATLGSLVGLIAGNALLLLSVVGRTPLPEAARRAQTIGIAVIISWVPSPLQ